MNYYDLINLMQLFHKTSMNYYDLINLMQFIVYRNKTWILIYMFWHKIDVTKNSYLQTHQVISL